MQYREIYAVLSRLNHRSSCSSYFAVVLEDRQKECQKIDDLPVLATCRSGTLVMLSSKVNGLVAHGSTR